MTAMRRNLLAAALLAAFGLSDAASSGAMAQDRRVEVVNSSGRTLREFYASNVNRTSWEEDILGNNVLPSGRSIVINIDDGSGSCRFDFLAVLEGGRRVEQRDFNVCRGSRFVVR
jgi:hypothetical protein